VVDSMVKKFDILQHELVPKHEVLDISEALKVLKELSAKPQYLPWLRASDPVAKTIGAKPGDIVRIVRKSPTARESIAYRYVIAG